MAAVDTPTDVDFPRRRPATRHVPTTAELVARARALRPLLAANASQGEADRRVTEESIKAMTDAGLFKIAVPRRYGGYETSVRTMLEVSAAVGEADGGTAWVLTLINVCSWLVGLLPQQAQDDIFGADPDALISGVLAPTADHRQGRRRLAGHRQVVLQLRVLARDLGRARHPGHRRRRRGGQPGAGAHPAR